jgi:Cu/Zn superoxide dismutase
MHHRLLVSSCAIVFSFAVACAVEQAPDDGLEASSEDELTFAGSAGAFSVFADPFGDGRTNPAEKIAGSVKMTISPELDGSVVSLTVKGLPAKTTFGAHAHAKTCAEEKGGGHYQHVPGEINGTSEVWLDFETSSFGVGRAQSIKKFPLRADEIKSVVVHAQATDAVTGKAGPKLACIDVKVIDRITFLHGTAWTAFTTTTPNPAQTIRGYASFVSWEAKSSSVVGLEVAGLPPRATFGAHLHAATCADSQGGGHYQHSPGVVSAESEVWLDFTTDGAGYASRGVLKKVALRPEQARSIVVHAQSTDPATGKAGPKLACIDLVQLKL